MSFLEVIHPYLDQIETEDTKLDQAVIDEAIIKLEPIVAQMLNGDMNLVLNVLYRLDIPEEKVKYTLFGDHEEKASKMLAELIVKREIIRRIFRLKYSPK